MNKEEYDYIMDEFSSLITTYISELTELTDDQIDAGKGEVIKRKMRNIEGLMKDARTLYLRRWNHGNEEKGMNH